MVPEKEGSVSAESVFCVTLGGWSSGMHVGDGDKQNRLGLHSISTSAKHTDLYTQTHTNTDKIRLMQ